ncbi:MAG: hypothetical protein RI883_527 [Bacteroidota bacterium]|jgi:hypothetical protein
MLFDFYIIFGKIKSRSMKFIFTALLLLIVTSLQSCGEKETSDEAGKTDNSIVSINGDWTLHKEEKNGKKLDFSGKPTAVTLTIKENGYFIFFDKITNEKISNSGVPKIQERYKGQYDLDGKELSLNHFVNDSLVSESYSIESLTATELILKSNTTKNIQHFKK